MTDPTSPERDELADSQSWVEPLLELRDVPPGYEAEAPFRRTPRPNSNATVRRWVVVACALALVAIAIALVVEPL